MIQRLEVRAQTPRCPALRRKKLEARQSGLWSLCGLGPVVVIATGMCYTWSSGVILIPVKCSPPPHVTVAFYDWLLLWCPALRRKNLEARQPGACADWC
ncbi:hypothetical protein NA56DRAFT_260910 [Hyaloscypha hepaticicola]|uniref:Uncharacterized protein n=1 Tax=Hyaloscypha hepaticicola TaxID=2082293 RepID=A0A2J6PV50_9HELO|nr:hypothetical protein NA56DRAFT_260910 [Hyaloscypha hepaticicola]